MNGSTNYIAVRANRQSDSDHWFEIEMCVTWRGHDEAVYDFASGCQYDVTPLDDVARDYTADNWGAAIYSGVRYAFNSRRDLRMLIHAIRGKLSSADMHDVAVIASNLVANSLQNGRVAPVDGWVVKEERLPDTA